MSNTLLLYSYLPLQQYLLTLVQDTPTMWLSEMRALLRLAGVIVDTSNIWRALRKHGLSMKKVPESALATSRLITST